MILIQLHARSSSFRTCLFVVIAVGLVCLTHPRIAVGQSDVESEAIKKTVTVLSEGLDADKESERDAAEAELLVMGAKALRYLPAVSDDASAEWRMRIDRVRKRLMEMDSEQTFALTRVTLSGRMTGRETLESIAKMTQNTLELDAEIPALEQQIDVAFENALFWEAIDSVLDQLGLSIPPRDGDRLSLMARPPEAPMRIAFATYMGGFRMEPISITKNLDLVFPEASSVTFQLSLAWEPRLTPAAIRFLIEDLSLVCDNGEVLRPKPNQGNEYVPSGSLLVASFEFDEPSRTARRIEEWKGTIEVAIPGRPVEVEFNDLDTARDTKLLVGDLEITLERARKNRDIYEVLIGVSMREPPATDAMQGWSSLIDAHLVGPDGAKTEHAGWATTRMTNNEIGLSFLFEVEDDLKGYRFVFQAPQSVAHQTLEYSLEQVPLP